MTEEIREKILKWIHDEHMHHSSTQKVDLPIKVFRNDTWETLSDVELTTESDCWEGDSPYVNSLELEKFIKEL